MHDHISSGQSDISSVNVCADSRGIKQMKCGLVTLFWRNMQINQSVFTHAV